MTSSNRSSRTARRVTPGCDRPGDHRHASRTDPPHEVSSDLTVEPHLAQSLEIDSGSTLYDEVALTVGVQEPVERGGVVARVEAPPPAAATRRVGDDDGVAGDGHQRVGPAQRNVGHVMPGHGQPHGIEVAAHDQVGGPAQGRQLGADRAGDVMHRPPGQPPGAVGRHRGRGRLLQGLVGEQPPGGTGQLRRRLTTQQRRLDQRGRAGPESAAHRGDVADPVGERQRVDLGQRGHPLVRRQVGDVGLGEL